MFLIILFIGIYIYDKNKKNEFTSKFFYMDTYIYVKIYDVNEKKATKILKDVENIYREYHELTDRYNEYKNIKNLYYIKNNKSNDEYITINKKLYNIIDYGIKWNKKTDGLIDISMGDIIDVWKKYRENKNGVPTKDELTNNNNFIILKNNNKIKNNHPNIDLGCIAKGYTTKIVGEYLKQNKINKFLINAGGNVLVGDNYKKENYSIGIEDPNSEIKDIFKVVSGNNISVVTSGGYERFYTYNNKKYHHIINPKTYYPVDNMKSVTVITKDSSLGDILSTYLFLISIEDGVKYINNLDGVEAIWYDNNDTIITSKGFDKYEYKNK